MTLDQQPDVLEDASSVPSPRPSSPPSRNGLFGFGAIPGEESDLASLLGSPQDDPASDSGTGSPRNEPPPLDDHEPSSPTSSAGSLTEPALSKGQLKETFRAGVRITTSTAHRVAARTPGQQHVGLYLADETDVKGIGDPLAEIAHRRGGLAGGKLSPDTNNALQAVMALAGYIAKQLKGIETARQLDGQIAAGVVQVGDVDEDAA